MRDERFLDKDGARLRVCERGAGSAVVLIHGWALDADMWSHQLSDLSCDYHVIAYDRRGFGFSTGEPSIKRDVADLRVLLDELHIKRAALVGMSQGARVVLHFAQQYPTFICSIVLDGPPPIADLDAESSSDIPLARYQDILRRHGIEAFRREWRQHALMQLQTKDPATRALLGTIIERYPGKDLVTDLAAESRRRIDWSTLTVPLLVINGDRDSSDRLAAGRMIVEVKAGARLATVPNAGHLPNLDNPSHYNHLLREFLRASAAL